MFHLGVKINLRQTHRVNIYLYIYIYPRSLSKAWSDNEEQEFKNCLPCMLRAGIVQTSGFSKYPRASSFQHTTSLLFVWESTRLSLGVWSHKPRTKACTRNHSTREVEIHETMPREKKKKDQSHLQIELCMEVRIPCQRCLPASVFSGLCLLSVLWGYMSLQATETH